MSHVFGDPGHPFPLRTDCSTTLGMACVNEIRRTVLSPSIKWNTYLSPGMETLHTCRGAPPTSTEQCSQVHMWATPCLNEHRITPHEHILGVPTRIPTHKGLARLSTRSGQLIFILYKASFTVCTESILRSPPHFNPCAVQRDLNLKSAACLISCSWINLLIRILMSIHCAWQVSMWQVYPFYCLCLRT